MSIASMLTSARQDLGLGEPNYIQDWYADRNGSAFDYNFTWCDAAVTYWAWESGNHNAVCPEGDRAYTVWHAQDFQQRDQWFVGTSANVSQARPGDIIFFDWSNTNDISHIDHVGVCETNLGGGQVQTIEGNTSDSCARRTRSYVDIAGFGRPPYGDGSGSPTYWSTKWRGTRIHVPTIKFGNVLVRGDFNSMNVTRLQNVMNVVFGYDILVDGDFGLVTESTLREIEATLNIEVNGQYGKPTADAFIDYIKNNEDKPEPDPEPQPEPKPEPEDDGSKPGKPDKPDPNIPAGQWWRTIDLTIQVPMADPPGTLHRGMASDTIRMLQRCLNRLEDAGIPENGMFGIETEIAVIAFQLTHKDEGGNFLRRDGVYDPATAKSLYLALV